MASARSPHASSLVRGLLAAVVVAVVAALASPASAASPFVPEPSAAAAETGAAAAPEPATPPGPRLRKLSNERTRSRWAYVVRRAYARRRPSLRSRAIKKLKTYTADNTPELVLALYELRKANGAVWVKVRLPMRPNNRTGWVLRRRLGRYRLVTTALRVNKRLLRASLYRRGRLIWRAPIGIGKRKWPTPRGRFYVRERLVPANKRGMYGVFAFGTSAYSPVLSDWPGGGVIGIHGTNRPGLIPGRISHGCIRVRNRRIARLRRLMPLGTPIRIR